MHSYSDHFELYKNAEIGRETGHLTNHGQFLIGCVPRGCAKYMQVIIPVAALSCFASQHQKS